jgi:galactokinase
MRTFSDVFGYSSQVSASAPGRVNLLGEHTDYNDGYVLPTIIPQQTKVEIAPSPNGRFRFYSANLKQLAEYAPGENVPHGFASYVHGCIEVLRERGANITPVSIHILSDVPIGSGLSSSAGLEVAVLRGLRELHKLDFDDVELALLGQQAEIRFAGVNCGILDQMACSLGRSGHMLLLDTRTLERKLLPLPADSALIVIDSGIPRALADSAYNERRRECESAARLLGVRALRDIVDPKVCEGLPAPLNRRARHVVTENNRVLQAAKGISASEFGALMNASHASLRDDYEVSVPGLDQLVAALQRHSQCYGARLTGAGFGGACVALARPAATEDIKQKVLNEYRTLGHHGTVLV